MKNRQSRRRSGSILTLAAVMMVLMFCMLAVAVDSRGHTGPGLREADRAIAFSRFARGSASATGPGLGLGLALAHEIARAHGGSIEIERNTGRGAVFAVRLPLAPREAR
jgi:signal transduction histidine kinase